MVGGIYVSLGLFPILPRFKKVLTILWEFAFISENDRHVDIITLI